MLGGIGGRRRRGRQRMRWLDSITDSMDVCSSELRGMVIDREAWHAAIHAVAKGQTRIPDQQKRMYQIRSVTQSCLTLCDPMNRSTPGLPVHHQLPEFTETHIH